MLNICLEKTLISQGLVTLLHIRRVLLTPQSQISPGTPRGNIPASDAKKRSFFLLRVFFC